MKPTQVSYSALALFLLAINAHGAIMGSKKNNFTLDSISNATGEDFSKLLSSFDPDAAGSDNVASVTTLTNTSKTAAAPTVTTGNVTTQQNARQAQSFTISNNPGRSPVPFGGLAGPASLGGGTGIPFGGYGGGPGIPFGGYGGFPGFGVGGNIGFDFGVGGYGLVEKAIVVVGGGILILLAVACAQAAVGGSGLLGLGSNGVSASAAGSASVGSAAASSAASASLSANVNQAINKKF